MCCFMDFTVALNPRGIFQIVTVANIKKRVQAPGVLIAPDSKRVHFILRLLYFSVNNIYDVTVELSTKETF